MIKETNKLFLNKWKDFPGPDWLKFCFVLIGLTGALELILPNFNFLMFWGTDIYEATPNFIGFFIGVLIINVGVGICILFWLSSYLFSLFQSTFQKDK